MLTQIQSANTDEELTLVLLQLSDWLADVGISTFTLSLADKDNLVTQLVIHHLYNRLVSFASWELIFSAEKLYNFTRHFLHITYLFTFFLRSAVLNAIHYFVTDNDKG